MKTIAEELKMRQFQNEFQKCYLNLLFTAHWLEHKNRQLLRPYGLTPAQYNVLRILRGQNGKGISATAIQERMVFRNSNVTRIIEKLLEKGYVNKISCEGNRRRNDISLTSAGALALQEAEPVIRKLDGFLNQTVDLKSAIRLNALFDGIRNYEPLIHE